MTPASDGTDSVTVDGLLDRAAADWGGLTAVVDGTRRTTYRELAAMCRNVAGGLADLGVSKGDRVAIWMPNRLEWVTAFFGAISAGAVVVPLNTALAPAEALYQLLQSGASVLIVCDTFRSRDYLSDSLTLREQVPQSLSLVVVGESSDPTTVAWQQLASGMPDFTSAVNHVPDPAMVLYTSGTTGQPKGAVHCHRFIQTLAATATRLRLSEKDCIVLYLPLFHVYALIAGLLLMVSVGAKIVLMERFRSPESLRLIRSEGATMVYGVPTTYIDQLNDPVIDEIDFAKIRFAITPLTHNLSHRVRAKFRAPCLNTYGSTETASTVIMPTLEDAVDVAVETVGRPLEGIRALIVDEVTGRPVLDGSQGLLLIRGASIMLGYHNDPIATAGAFNDEGWFRTGDLVRRDAKGNIVFIGRHTDHYRVGGELVDPVEVETVLQAHPAVQRAAAAGVPDDRLGQVGYAWVQLRGGATVTVEELKAHSAHTLAAFKVPRQIVPVAELPTTPSGKVQKFRLLAAREAPGPDRDTEPNHA
ncbi:MAG TPA: AMP-binding protein [Mycobacterium sp.]|jgi:acyl-CoA synthetase (AMP-forming)/AMP-acid ligase II|nr:AMP-binding protein [Mycobacterium sp.]